MLYTFLSSSFRVAAAMLISGEDVFYCFQESRIRFEEIRVCLKVGWSFAKHVFDYGARSWRDVIMISRAPRGAGTRRATRAIMRQKDRGGVSSTNIICMRRQ
jgi:hypothetical protein